MPFFASRFVNWLPRGFFALGLWALTATVGAPAARAADDKSDMHDAEWIWSPRFKPGHAPIGSVNFRKTVKLSTPASAKIEITCDNVFSLSINGQRVGRGDDWQQLYSFDVTQLLKTGKNTLSINGENTDVGSAGVLAKLTVTQQDGRKVSVVTDASWKCSLEGPAGWQKPGFDDSSWQSARSFGSYGCKPWGAVGAGGATAGANVGRRFKAPPGFEVQQVLGGEAGSLVNLTFMEDGNLLVSGEGGSLYLVTNLAGGVATAKAEVWSDKVKFCQGLLAYKGHVYAVGKGPEGPGLYRLTDTTGVGHADKLENLLRTDFNMSDHGPHAVVLGPDGFLYVLLGNHTHYIAPGVDVEKGAAENSEGHLAGTPYAASSPHRLYYEGDLVQPKYEDANGHARGIKAPGGTVQRLDPDAKKVELFCGGFRNPFDIAFNRAGELFTFDADMEWDENLPWYRPIRVNHAIPGAEFGWRSGWSKWPDYYLDSLGSVYDVGRGSPTGLTFYNHTAYPAEYRDKFILCDWSRGRILMSHLDRSGATYKGTWESFVEGQPMAATDCEVGPDGAVYFTVGGRGTQGGVFRVVYTGETASGTVAPKPAVKDEPSIWPAVRQPQLQAAWARPRVAKVKKVMGDFWAPELIAVAEDAKAAADDRVQALDLLQLFGPLPQPALLVRLSDDQNLEVRAKAVYLLGVNHDDAAVVQLRKLLDDPQPLIRRLACESLVRAGASGPVERVVPMLADPDRYVAWAARMLLERQPVETWRKAVLKSELPRVFLVGSVALLRVEPERPNVDAILARAQAMLGQKLSDDDQLDLLRVIQLALIRSSLEGDQVPQLRDALSRLFPAADWRVNRELVRLLVYLQDPTLAPRLMAELDGKASAADKLHFAMYARFLRVGWTPELRSRLLKFYESTRPMIGGNSFHGYFANATNDFIHSMSAAEQVSELANSARSPDVAQKLVKGLPDQLTPEQLAALRALDRQLVGDPRPEARALADAVLARLGRAGDEPTLAYLHATFESSPERREDLAEAVAQFVLAHPPRPADRDLLIHSLSVVEGSTARDVLLALKRFEPVTDAKPDLLRQVILVGLKLQNQGGKDAVALLQHWTSQKHSQPRDPAETALAGWQQWFSKTYPTQPEPKLPVESHEDKYTMAQINAFLDSAAGRHADPQRGALVFEKALCIKCHKFGNRGEGVGPDLTNVSRRFQRKEILESVIFPSAVISDQFASKTVITKDGRTFTGIVGPTADGVTIMQSSLKRVEIAKADIDEIVPSKISAMPERLFNAPTLEEIADLFAYLAKVPE